MAVTRVEILGDCDPKVIKSFHKYLSLERALQLLESKKMWFSNPLKWKDPFERRFIDGIYPSHKDFVWKERVFCMCITRKATSEASWKAYSDSDIAVKLEFCAEEYIDIIKKLPGMDSVFFGKVDYQQANKIRKPLKKICFSDKSKPSINSKLFKAKLLLLKRKAFEYECEFRAIVVKKKKSSVSGIDVDIPNLHKLIKSITIGPTVGDNEYEMIKEYLKTKYNFSANQIMRSDLYREPSHPPIFGLSNVIL